MNLQSVLPNVKATVLNTGGEEAKEVAKPQHNTTRTMVMINKDGSRVTLQVVNKSPTTTSNSTVVTQSSASNVTALAQAERRIVTRSKTGSLAPKQFPDSVTVTSGSLKTALAKSIEENSTLKITNKDSDITYFTRSKVSNSVLSQRSVYFKLGKCRFCMPTCGFVTSSSVLAKMKIQISWCTFIMSLVKM